MRRREWLASLLGAAAAATPATALAQASARGRRGRPRATPVVYPPIRPLTADKEVVDGRPCFSPDGSTVLFMRSRIVTATELGPSEFWTIPAVGGDATLFASKPNVQFTRPDWSWTRDEFAIAYCEIVEGRNSIALLDATTGDSTTILEGDTAENRIYSYPSWYPGGRFLSITNYWSNEEGDPETRQRLLLLNLAGDTRPLTNPDRIWPGMSSVFPGPGCSDDVSPPIAFAGERPNAQGYNQDDNQIWVRHSDGRVAAIDGLQARAPWWSPDGRLLAFESNRLTGKKYQIFLQSPYHPRQIRPITPPTMEVQHAKFSPDGRFVVFAYVIDPDKPVPPGDNAPQGIAIADLGG